MLCVPLNETMGLGVATLFACMFFRNLHMPSPLQGTPLMTNGLNFSMFKSSILNSLVAGTSCLLATRLKKNLTFQVVSL